MTQAFFFDTYALVEILKDNPKYRAYADIAVTITVLNLTELAYSVLQDFGRERAIRICEKFSECVHEIDADIIVEAAEFCREHKKQNLSYADCIGYIFAKKHNMLFLTGDEQFRYIPNVEFVKS